MDYTVVIGLEVHVQLLTRSKIFCSCANLFNPDNPNVQTCPVCLGLPGSLPVMNREAFRLAMKTAMALNCEIARFTKWDRKQYYYPDLPKGYQISQYDLPFSSDGFLEFRTNPDDEDVRRIGIIRAHLEEDAGKNMHDETGRGTDSQVDLNRAGTPLLEIVSYPDMRSAAEAKRYLEELRLLLTYLGVSDCNMQEGSLRCDANVNLHILKDNKKYATPIVEIKNLNSFRNTELAIEYEVTRQYAEWQKTGKVLGEVDKETRGYNAEKNETFAQRGKEEASDYRYFPDPDLVPVTVTEEEVDRVRESLCEFPADRRQRFLTGYELSNYDAAVIIDQGLTFANYFELVAQTCGDGKQASNWVTQDVLREMKERKLTIDEFFIPADVLGELLKRINAKQITIKSAREVFQELLDNAGTNEVSVARIDQIVAERGLAPVSDTGKIEGVIDAVLAKNEKAVADYRGGKQAAIGSLIGQVMRELKGADANAVRELLVKKLG
jgi:aspartyl-tRNA(Asn)/glutamyl-tRNA(Gln) amidotransferase subunit B